MSRLSKKDIDALKASARQVLLEHPMYGVISERIEPWLERVAKVDPERLVWHARRTLGFGGSEIGVLVKNRRGEKGNFGSSAGDIVKGKLLMSAPFGSRGPIKRGNDLEPLNGYEFKKLCCAQTIQEGIALLSESRSERGRLRYSPDDMVVINYYQYEEKRAHFTNKGYGHLMPELPNPEFKDELLALVDYKCPTEVKREANGNPMADFEYVCQLTGGTGLLMEQGFSPDLCMLTQWDMSAWEPVPLVVQYDPNLYAEIIDACEYYWDGFVMNNLVPEPVTRMVHLGYPDKPDLAEALDIYGAEFAKSQVAKSFFETRSKAIQNSIKSVLDLAPPDTKGSMVLDKLKVAVEYEINKDTLFKDLVQAGAPVKDLVSATEDFDSNKLLAYVVEREEDLTPFKADAPDLDKMKLLSKQYGVAVEAHKQVSTRFAPDKKSITINEQQMLKMLQPQELPDLAPLLGEKPVIQAIGDEFEAEESELSEPLRLKQ